MKKPGHTGISLVACLLSGYIFVDPIHGQRKLNFDEIVTKFITKGEADSLYVGNNYSHQELEINEELKNGVLSSVEQKLYQVEKRNGALVSKLIADNNAPVTDSEFKQKKEIVTIGAKLLERFEFHFERNETLAGERCWVFSFRPKKNLPERTREDRALNQLAGEIWIARETLNFKKLTAKLLSDVKYEEIGSGGRLHQINCLVTAKTIDGRFAVDYAQIEYVASARFFFITVFRKHVIKKIYYKNYERRTK